MARTSAGILLFRIRRGVLEVLLAHPGGPFWARRDEGAWTIPKGQVEEGEDALAAARREFTEETGFALPEGPLIALSPVKQKGGKTVYAWAAEGDCDLAQFKSNSHRVEYPPKSGQWRSYPEVDRAGFFTVAEARTKLNAAQVALVEELERVLVERGRPVAG